MPDNSAAGESGGPRGRVVNGRDGRVAEDLAVAAVRRPGDAHCPEGRGVREAGARLLRPHPGRPAHPHQGRFFRDLALPHLENDHRRLHDLRRRGLHDEAAIGRHVRGKPIYAGET